jgi:hypothetical protein
LVKNTTEKNLGLFRGFLFIYFFGLRGILQPIFVGGVDVGLGFGFSVHYKGAVGETGTAVKGFAAAAGFAFNYVTRFVFAGIGG